jgi:hypothetical protein
MKRSTAVERALLRRSTAMPRLDSEGPQSTRGPAGRFPSGEYAIDREPWQLPDSYQHPIRAPKQVPDQRRRFVDDAGADPRLRRPLERPERFREGSGSSASRYGGRSDQHNAERPDGRYAEHRGANGSTGGSGYRNSTRGSGVRPPAITPPRPPSGSQERFRRAVSDGTRSSRRRPGWRWYAVPVLLILTALLIRDVQSNSLGVDPVAAGVDPSGVAVIPEPPMSSPLTADPDSSTADPAATLDSTVPSDSGSASGPLAQPTSEESGAGSPGGGIPVDTPGAGSSSPASTNAKVPPGTLPDGPAFAVTGLQTFRVVPGTSERLGTAETVRTFSIEIEDGVTPAEGETAFADTVVAALADPRGWTSVLGLSLQRVDPEVTAPDFRVTLASQQTTYELCGHDVPLESSCYVGAYGRVVLNDSRWVRGSLSYGTDLPSYRTYAVNHEVGHALGVDHEPCRENGGLAPVMMQQSWSTSNDDLAAINNSVTADGSVCLPNPWPHPVGP